ncbi:unnamed protein product [Mycena citricolor]|uniref:NADH:flavin oxidoreductase/NADH oxidase N-terminal domain-containing protein n=1 Tax=Mycena citricolor TaxID=2018698 RepID=A0AAD2HX12_9AGAR|nr:unnamed protein product [Mycena citricolor]
MALFTPTKLGSVTIPNRIGMSALTRNRSDHTVPNAIMLEYYVQRAKGGTGFIVTEGTLPSRQGTEWPNAPGIFNQEQIDGWKKIVDAVHAEGSKIYCQLLHLGRISHPDAPEQLAAGEPVWAPSAISARGGKFRLLPGVPGYVTPTEVPDPTVLIAQIKQAAVNAKKAGFDGVELHGANGYLVAQFLETHSNQRTDKWGGSVENRTRFALETLKALIEVYGENVSIKINPAGGYNDMGMPLQDAIDTYSYLLKAVDTMGLSYVALVRYSEAFDPEYDGKKRGTPHDIVATYSPFLQKTPIWVNSGVTPEEAEKLVSGGEIAGVFFGFAQITCPDVGYRIKAGIPLDNAPDLKHTYGIEGVDYAIGYTDYPAAK